MIRVLGMMLLLALASPGFVLSQSGVPARKTPGTVLRVRFSSTAPEKLYLLSFYGIDSRKIDSAAAIKKTFTFANSALIQTGFYRLYENDTNYYDLILTGGESVILEFESRNLKKKVVAKNSRENQALLEMKEYRQVYHAKKKEIISSFKAPVNDPARFSKLRKKLDSLETASNKFNEGLIKKHEGSYFSLSSKPILPVVYTDSAILRSVYRNDTLKFMKENFFNNIDFSRPELANSTLLPNQYMKYLEKYVDYDETGFRYAIDLVLSKAKANNTVYELSLDMLMRVFGEAGPEVIFEYLVDHYYEAGACSKSYADKAEKLRSLRPGNILPEVPLGSFTEYADLKELVGKQELSLLFFWSSHCAFCTESVPLLMKAYQQYHSKGLEVFAFSMDEKKEDWIAYVEEKHIPWKNYNELKGWDSGIVRSLLINKTPTFFLVGRNGVILGKSHNFVEIERLIARIIDKN